MRLYNSLLPGTILVRAYGHESATKEKAMGYQSDIFERFMMAAAFAEEGEFETARSLAAPRPALRDRKRRIRRATTNRPRPELRAPRPEE
jgi:hypothetical protein